MMYDFKSEDFLQSYTFSSLNELIFDICAETDNLRRYEFIAIYTNVNNLKKIIKELDLDMLADINKISDKVIMTIAYDGNLIVEKMYENNNFKNAEATLVYLDDEICKYDKEVLKNLSKNNERILLYKFSNEIPTK